MARKISKKARACIASEAKKHYKKGSKGRKHIALAYDACRAKGYKLPAKPPKKG